MNNQFTFVGRITKDLELRSTGKTDAVIVPIAIQRNFKKEDGTYDTDFLSCKVFGAKAVALSKYSKKGDMIVLSGRVQMNNYTDKDGKKVYGHEFIADNITFVATTYKAKEENYDPVESKKEETIEEDIEETSVKLDDLEITDEDLPF